MIFYYILTNVNSISNTVEKGPVKNLIAKALTDRILQAARDGQKFTCSQKGCT